MFQKNTLKNIALEKTSLVVMDHLDQSYFKNIKRFIKSLEDLEEERKDWFSELSFQDFYKKYFPLMIEVNGTTIPHKWMDLFDDNFCNIQTSIENLETVQNKLDDDEIEFWEILDCVRASLRQIKSIKFKMNKIDELRSIIVYDISAVIPDSLMKVESYIYYKFTKQNLNN